MKEQLISFETSKLAKEKGFKESTVEYYSSDTKVTSITYNEFPAPPQSVFHKWLRDNHNIMVIAVPFTFGKHNQNLMYLDYGECLEHDSTFCSFILKTRVIDGKSQIVMVEDFVELDSYEEALEKGLFEALKYIDNE